ncbi:MAG: phosphate ABC transporter substrate-binding protein, PhoT family, partial [Oscillospiraceae bacterium]|nr:phosphate ABC transporter substrate-binding protein, PhoT family [Oscillospiraceae bacterium]
EMHTNPFGFSGSAIGFSFRYYVSDLVGNGDVKMLSLDGVSPTPEHIADGSYPIISSFFAVYDKHNTHPDLPVLLEWMQSDEAQKIIADTGFIPLHPQQ